VRHAAGASAERPRGYGPTHSASLSTCARRERPRGSRAAEQGDELAPPEVEHGVLPGTLCASLRQAQVP
jgi:hypothetical protein